MTDKAEMPDDLWIRGHDRKYATRSFIAVVRPSVGDTRYIRADLYDAQAAEIERLREQYRWRDVKVELPRGVGGVGQPELEAIVTNGSYAEVTEWMGSYWLTEDLEPTHWLPLPPLPGTRDTP